MIGEVGGIEGKGKGEVDGGEVVEERPKINCDVHQEKAT